MCEGASKQFSYLKNYTAAEPRPPVLKSLDPPLKMKNIFYLIVLSINMSEKKYSKLLDIYILTCLLNPHSLVSTKQTCQYIRDCFDVRSNFSTI